MLRTTRHHDAEHGGSDGRVIAGLVLLALGVIIILGEAISAGLVTAILLIVIGLYILRPRRADQGEDWSDWARGWWRDAPREGRRAMSGMGGFVSGATRSIGDRQLAPASVAELADLVEHGIGDVRLDLTRCAVPSTREERAIRLRVGDVHVIAPTAFPLETVARVRVGDVKIGGTVHDGRDLYVREPAEAGEGPALVLRIDVVAGDVRVERP